MCMLCGDPYNLEHVLAPFSRIKTPVASTVSGADKVRRRIEIIISSYHGATEFRDELIHGFILRILHGRPTAPILVYGINDLTIHPGGLSSLTATLSQNNTSSGAGNESLRPLLVSEGKNLSERLNAHFINSNTSQQK
ncbi:Uncharacterized protein FKW44_016255, partial [Caligus rogercresseyi]